jgi:TfoX/Sxy family transcriptional regulator of competence genes
MKDDSFKEFVVDQIHDLGQITCRAMFGGYGFYQDRVFFGILYKDRLYFKTDPKTRPEYINLQFVGRWVQNFKDLETLPDPTLRFIAIQNAIFDSQQDRLSYGMTTRISKKWFNDTLEAEVLAFVNFRRTNSFIRPLITYVFTDHVKGTIGGEIYRGPENSFFGRLKENQGVFTELRYSF